MTANVDNLSGQKCREAGVAQWWKHSPPTNVALVRFPDSASYVGWVCWFSTLLREAFLLQVLRFPLLLKSKPTIWYSFFELIAFLYSVHN